MMRRAVALVLGVMAYLGVAAGPSAAHVELAASSPAADTTVTEPVTTVRLEFTDALQADADHAVGLFGPDEERLDNQQTVTVSDVAVETGVQPLPRTDTYTVRWLVIAADGHTLDGSYTFIYEGPIEESEQATPPPVIEPAPSADASSADEVSAATEVEPTADPSPLAARRPSGTTGTVAGIVAMVAAVGAIGVGAVAARRRRRAQLRE